jgi:carbon monoxide dehydrogenase subunit G
MTGEKEPGTYTGKVSLKLGPFGASFDGEATVQFDQAAKSGHVEGKGVDKRGGSRSRMTVDFALTAPAPASTTVRVDADVVLSGAIAQFGRTGIIDETAKILIGDFVTRLEQRLAPPPGATVPPTPAPAPASMVRLLWLSLQAWLTRLFRPAT